MLLQKILPHLRLPELAVLLVVFGFFPTCLGCIMPMPIMWKASFTGQCCYVHLQLLTFSAKQYSAGYTDHSVCIHPSISGHGAARS